MGVNPVAKRVAQAKVNTPARIFAAMQRMQCCSLEQAAA
jgi:hypothetical protein